MVVDEVDGAVAVRFEVLELRRPRAAALRDRHLPSLKIGMSQKTHGHGQPRDVCIVVKRSIDSTAGTSSGIDSTKSSGRLSRSGNGHWSRLPVQRAVRVAAGACRPLMPGEAGDVGRDRPDVLEQIER